MTTAAQPHRRADHPTVVTALKAQPGVWLPVGEYRNRMSADDIARRIRCGYPFGSPAYGTPYTPVGAFETRTRLTDDGTLVEARFTSEARPSVRRATPAVGPDDPRRVQPPTDAERVLGQIERGEVRAGAEAARQIAARHQAAYGDSVWGPNRDAAWADAINGLHTTDTSKDVTL